MSDQDLTFTIGANADGAERTINEVKQFLSDAADVAKSLNAMVGHKLSDSLKQTSGSAQALGASLEDAFSPLEVIAFAQAIVSAAQSLSTLIADVFIYTQAEKDAYAHEVSVNSQILKMVEHTKQLRRERQLLEAPDQKARNALKEKFLIEDQQGTSKHFAKQLKAKMAELQADLWKKVTVRFADPLTGMPTPKVKVLFSQTKEGEEKIRKLREDIGLLHAKVQETAAAERLLAKQNQEALAQEALQRHLSQVINGLHRVQVITLSAQKDRIRAVRQANQKELTNYQQTFAGINASAQQFNNQQLAILMGGIGRNSAQIIRASQQRFKKLEAEEAASLERRRKAFDRMFKGISGVFDTFVNGLISGNETLGQAWAKMVNEMASKFLSGLERQLMGFLEHKLMELSIHTTTEAAKDAASKAAHAKEDKRTAYSAAKGAWESTVHIPIVGPILAPIAAATTFAAVTAFGSAEGGQYLVPSEQLTMLHRNEMVLPAGVAQKMRGVIDSGGGGGITVVVNHSVNAVDAESFQSHVRRHANMIGNEVARALRKKKLAS